MRLRWTDHFFFEMDALTKSSCWHDEKIVRFSIFALFLHVNSAFYALERNMHQFLPIFVQHGDRRLAVPEGTTPSQTHPVPQPPQNDVFGCGTSKNIILGRLRGGVSLGEG